MTDQPMETSYPSMHVLPELFLERVSEHPEQAEEQQHVNANRRAFGGRGFRHIIEIVDEVRNETVVLERRQFSLLFQHELLLIDGIALRPHDTLGLEHLLALQF